MLVQEEHISSRGMRGRSTSGLEMAQAATTTTTATPTTIVTKNYTSYRPKKEAAMHNYEYMIDEYISPVYIPYQTVIDDPSASPFEMRWHGAHRPRWATKVGQQDVWTKKVPEGKHICYCSVGKAAGSSVSGLLGFQLHGPDVYFIPSGLLAHYTTHMFHYDVNDCADDTPYYLFTMRHPLERLNSAFRYDRDNHGDKENSIIYNKCKFSDLNTLAVHGLSAHGRATEECQQLAYDLVRGSGYEYSRHMFANYHFYRNVSFANAQYPETSKILAIRTEHMEDDWNAAERAIHDDDDPPIAPIELNVPHLNVNKDDYTGTRDNLLSTKAQILLCDALCEEIQTYKNLLKEAVNLRPEDYDQSMAELAESCPIQVVSSQCEQ